MNSIPPERDERGSVRAVERAFKIIGAMADERVPLGIAELAARMDLPQPTIHRLLGTLVGVGWVEQDPQSSRYRLGTGLLGIGAVAQANSPLLQQARPIMGELSESTGLNSFLSVLIGKRVAYLARVQGKLARNMDFVVGATQPAHATADGKLLLAYRPAAERKRLLTGPVELRSYTPTTKTAFEDLEEEFTKARLEGVAFDRGERYDAWSGAAVPIFGPGEEVVAAILCGGNQGPSTSEALEALAYEMRLFSEELSRRLGRAND